jgi:uncharacterized protein (TIGR03435 family)
MPFRCHFDEGEAVGRVVVNKTGITGQFDMRLKWAPDDQPHRC